MPPGVATPLPPLDEALRLGAAILAGAVLGLNRNLRGKAAGLRTHALVALGAALVVVTGAQLADRDITRVVQGVITGIGFIGAGVILHPRRGTDRVRGLTTAASVWVAAALGVAAGAGLWSLLALGALGTLAVLAAGGPVEDAARRRLLHRRERRAARLEPTSRAPATPPEDRRPPAPPSPPPSPPRASA
jgi:putative Mg2+ transporter-C (MgtC) family protein